MSKGNELSPSCMKFFNTGISAVLRVCAPGGRILTSSPEAKIIASCDWLTINWEPKTGDWSGCLHTKYSSGGRSHLRIVIKTKQKKLQLFSKIYHLSQKGLNFRELF